MTATDRLARVGKEWDLEIEVLKEQRRHDNDGRRYRIAMAVLGGIAASVAALGIWGLWWQDFGPVAGFWSAAGPIFGTIIGYYFGKQGDEPPG